MNPNLISRPGLAAALAALPLAICMGGSPGARAAEAGDVADAERIERGGYLVSTMGCHDCHTPAKPGPDGPEPDMSRALSGHPESVDVTPVPALPASPWAVMGTETFTAWAGPWGVSFTANLTPDPETGLGKWSFEDFRDTIRNGRRMGRGRPLLPPMPFPVYRNLTDEDLRAVFAYLQTIPAVRNHVPEPLPPPTPAP